MKSQPTTSKSTTIILTIITSIFIILAGQTPVKAEPWRLRSAVEQVKDTRGFDGVAGIVASIDKAPVVADGDVTGQPFDYVITLDGSLDPQVLGRGLVAGGTIKVFLPIAFDLSNIDPAFPLADLPTPFPPVPPLPPMPCLPGNLQCTTAVILRGWPQDPLFPPVAFHALSIDLSENALVFTAAKDIGLVPGADRAPYIKQLHLILNGLRNPAPGKYRIRVEAATGPDGTVERGEGLLEVLAKVRPSINVTSVFVQPFLDGMCGPGQLPPNENNPIYQIASVGDDAPFVWSFLLWGKDKVPLDNVSLRRVGHNAWWMIRNKDGHFRFRDIIGSVRIDAPPGARGHSVRLNNDDPMFNCDTLLSAAPVTGATPGVGPQPVGRLDLRFIAGNEAGVYRTTLSLWHGNSVEMMVTAEVP